jgi:cation diffusion facilitator family transporter
MLMAATSSSKTVIYAALFGNLLVALTKFGAAWWTGSSAMLSEGLHSLVDTSNQLLLLYGMHRAELPPDEKRPLGYGRELYFWSFIVALLMFALGAGAAFYEGVNHILEPVRIVDPVVNYVVLALSFAFEFVTWLVALKHFRASKGRMGYYEAVRRSKDPTSFMVLFEDSAALAGLVIAFAGTLAAERLGMPVLDGVAAIGIGLVLGVTAIILARESKELLIGEPASPRVNESIMRLAAQAPGIERANGLFTTHLGPNAIVASLSVEFCDDMTAPEIEKAVVALERQIKAAHPEVTALFIKPQTTSSYRKSQLAAAAQ